MGFAFFIKDYITWHYGLAFRDIFGLASNFLWFGYNFFSIPLMLKTLISPFYRIRLKDEGTFDIQSFFANVAVNTITRIIGLILRLIMITLGVAFEIALITIAVAAFLIWVLLPLVIPALIITGITFIL